MTAAAVACLPIFFTGGRISRWGGALFFAYCLAYVAFLALAATGHGALGTFRAAMLWFVIPIPMTVLGLGVSVAAWIRRPTPSSHRGSE